MENFLFENNVDGMRARDLRNLLVQKLGVDPGLISRIIDRDELKKMVNSIVYDQYKQRLHAEFLQMSYKVAAVVGALTLLFVCRNIIWGFFLSVYEMIGESSHKSVKKFKLLVYNAKRKKFIGVLALTASLVLELSVAWMQLAVLLSWVLSRDHFLRRFMLPTLSFPVSANTLVQAAGGKSTSAGGSASSGGAAGSDSSVAAAIGGYSMDVGPMLTIMALNFVITKLDNLAAGIVLEHKRGKEERRARKQCRQDSRQREQEGENGTELRKPKTSAAKTDAESIEDSLKAFFGGGGGGGKSASARTSTSQRAPPGAEKLDAAATRDGSAGSLGREAAPQEKQSYVPGILRQVEEAEGDYEVVSAEDGAQGAAGEGLKGRGAYAGTEDGWLD